MTAMSLRQLPEAKTFQRPQNFQWDAPSDVLAKWAETAPMAAVDDDTTITMFDVIGEDWWTGGGVTAKRISAALRQIGDKDVTVKINSPGGDMFEGIAIYNLLRAHKAKVTVEVLGWAASAASIIAMAGDEIRMGLGTFMMVHKPWGAVVGTDDDFFAAGEAFKQFTSSLIDIYEARTGLARSAIEKLVVAETYMGPSEAVKNGFADVVDHDLNTDKAENSAIGQVNVRRRMDALLAKQGVPRVERRRMFAEVAGGTHDAVPTVTHDAGFEAAARQLINAIRS
jgi:ATP-dependent Clp protease protease subunit